jgi:hypothetical protein
MRFILRKVWRCQRGNKKPDIEEEQTIYGQKNDKQWSTKHYIENLRLSNTNPTKIFLFLQLHLFDTQKCNIQIKNYYKHSSDMKKWCRYKRSNQNPYIEEGQTILFPKDKAQTDMIHKTLHRTLRIEPFSLI